MSGLATIPQAEQQKPVEKQHKPYKTTRAVTEAIKAMVWDGLPRRQAAEKAGISDHGLYKALRSPPVKAAYLAELEVLRLSERARSIHRLTELREQDDNKMVAFNAAKELAGSADDSSSHANSQKLPGLVVQINVGPGTSLTQPAPLIIDNEGK